MQALQPDTLIKNPTVCRVTSAVVLARDAQSVWSIVGNFSNFTAFIPARAYIEMLGTGVGCLRKKLFKDGNIDVEQLNAYDDQLMHMTWSTIFNTFNLIGHVFYIGWEYIESSDFEHIFYSSFDE